MSLLPKNDIIMTNRNEGSTTDKAAIRAHGGGGFSVTELDEPYITNVETTESISNVAFTTYNCQSCDGQVGFFTSPRKFSDNDSRRAQDKPTSSYMLQKELSFLPTDPYVSWIKNTWGVDNGGVTCGECVGCFNSCDGCFNICVVCTAGCTSVVTECGSCDNCTGCVMGCQSGFSCVNQFTCTSGCFTSCQGCAGCVLGCTTGCNDSETSVFNVCTACAAGCTNWASGACKVCNAECNACVDAAYGCSTCYASLYQVQADHYICTAHYDSGKCRNYCVNGLCDPCFQCAEGTGCMGCVCGCQTYCVDNQGAWLQNQGGTCTGNIDCGSWVVVNFVQEKGNPSCVGCTTVCVDECNASCYQADVA